MFDTLDNLRFSVHGGGDSGGVAGAVEGLLTALESLLSLPAAEIFPTLLPGIAGMQNIHPLFVHFPIAFLSAFVCCEAVATLLSRPQWRQWASLLLYAGCVCAGFTVMAGFIAAASVPHTEQAHEIMEIHEQLGITVLLLSLALALWRRSGKPVGQAADYAFLSFAGILGLLLVFTADLGGFMVYKYAVAVSVENAVPAPELHEHEHDHSHSH